MAEYIGNPASNLIFMATRIWAIRFKLHPPAPPPPAAIVKCLLGVTGLQWTCAPFVDAFRQHFYHFYPIYDTKHGPHSYAKSPHAKQLCFRARLCVCVCVCVCVCGCVWVCRGGLPIQLADLGRCLWAQLTHSCWPHTRLPSLPLPPSLPNLSAVSAHWNSLASGQALGCLSRRRKEKLLSS